MKTSDKAKDIMKAMEKLALQPYDDQVGITLRAITSWVKGATIGYGHLIKSSEWSTYKSGINKNQAEDLFEKDLAPFEQAVDNMTNKKLSQNEFDALVMLAFNIGISALQGSSVIKMINGGKGSYSTLELAWKAWNKSQGKVMNGLVKRRALEYDLYSKGVYKYFV